MRIGFTGTREGMTPNQRSQFWSFILRFPPDLFRHGVCVGADSQAVNIVRQLTPRPKIFGHFGDIPGMTCDIATGWCDDTAPPEPCLVRNRHIVDGSDMLIACPKGPEERRSGTWATVRYARKQGKRILIIWPDGTITEEPTSGETA